MAKLTAEDIKCRPLDREKIAVDINVPDEIAFCDKCPIWMRCWDREDFYQQMAEQGKVTRGWRDCLLMKLAYGEVKVETSGYLNLG